MPPVEKKARRDNNFMASGEPEGEVNGWANEDLPGSGTSVPSFYFLHCTVCKNDYESRSDWLSHLGRPEHQKLARLECLKNWGGDKKMRECVIAVFSSFPLTSPGTVEDLLEFFSVRADRLATDFVWWPERPQLGFLQFESRVKVAEILKNGSNGFVQDKLVQLKKAVDFLDLEWNGLLPFEGPELTLPTTSHKSSSDAPSPGRSLCSASSTRPTGSPLISPSCLIPVPRTPLQRQFNSVCQSIEIPEEECEHALQIVRTIQQILRKDHPTAQVSMFRNYYLRLRNNGSDLLLLYAYITERSSFPDSYGYLRSNKQDGLFTKLSSPLPGYKRLQLDQCPVKSFPFENNTTGFRFSLTFHFQSLAEVQLSLLLQYLCTFDPRVRPVLGLVHFWARCQNVRVAEENTSKAIVHSKCPEPASLEWLVILFLMKEGILPCVRDIQQRPHKPLLVGKSKMDIGFSFHPDYVREWTRVRPPPPEVNTDQFLLSVVNLTQQLFDFYSTRLEEGRWLLNTRDGEIIQMEGNRCLESGLTREESSVLYAGKRGLKVNMIPIHMVHPLYVKWKLSFCDKTWKKSTCQKMKSTAESLANYIKLLETTGGSDSRQTLDSVLSGEVNKGRKRFWTSTSK